MKKRIKWYPKMQLYLFIMWLTVLMTSVKGQETQEEGTYYDDLSNLYPGMSGSDGISSSSCKTEEKKPPCCAVPDLGKGNARQKASNIAIKAAQDAKAANEAQVAAAEAAAQQVKAQLADKAMQSAKAAEAALAGKQQVVDQFEHELKDSETAVTEIYNSLQSTQNNANLANQAAAEAQSQLQDLKKLIICASNNLATIEAVAHGTQQELTEKTQLLEAAKRRIDNLRTQLSNSRQDLEQTKQATYKAICSAKEAQQKAQRSRRLARAKQYYASRVANYQRTGS